MTHVPQTRNGARAKPKAMETDASSLHTTTVPAAVRAEPLPAPCTRGMRAPAGCSRTEGSWGEEGASCAFPARKTSTMWKALQAPALPLPVRVPRRPAPDKPVGWLATEEPT